MVLAVYISCSNSLWLRLQAPSHGHCQSSLKSSTQALTCPSTTAAMATPSTRPTIAHAKLLYKRSTCQTEGTSGICMTIRTSGSGSYAARRRVRRRRALPNLWIATTRLCMRMAGSSRQQRTFSASTRSHATLPGSKQGTQKSGALQQQPS